MPKKDDPSKPLTVLGKRKSKKLTEVSMAKVQKIKEGGKQTHLRASGTRKNYVGYIQRGRDWMASHFLDPTLSATGGPAGLDQTSDDDEIYNDPDFKQALEGRPTQYSDKALALWISYKCFYENLGISTCDGAYSAYK